MNEAPNHQQAVVALQQRLDSTSRRTDPVAWAVASYRLGMATAEAPTGAPRDNLAAALDFYAAAAEVLTEKAAPVEHARVTNAAASAHRQLGSAPRAVELFERAERLLAGRGIDRERAAMLSNLGLARSDCGSYPEAIEAFHLALDLLVGDDEEPRRARVAARHNLAQALMATGADTDLLDAIEVLQAAEADSAQLDAPLHQGMVWHSLGVAHKGRAEKSPDDKDDLIQAALMWFDRCLTIFTVNAFPFQHAVAKQNQGLCLAGRDDVDSLRRALASYESALSIFDPRLHAPHWRSTYSNMESVEEKLESLFPGLTRADHFATLLGAMDEIERLAELRQRLLHFERLPAKQRLERLTDLAYAAVRQPPRSFVATIKTTIMVLMELPDEVLSDALRAQMIAHRRLDAHDRRAADFILDEAINALLFGPQRIRVRDLLVEIGWERP